MHAYVSQIQIYRVAEDDKSEEEREGVSCWRRDPLVPGWQRGWHGAVCLHWKRSGFWFLSRSSSSHLTPPCTHKGPNSSSFQLPTSTRRGSTSPCHGRHSWFELDLVAGKVDSGFAGGWFAGAARVLQFAISVVAVIPQFPLNLLNLCQQFPQESATIMLFLLTGCWLGKTKLLPNLKDCPRCGSPWLQFRPPVHENLSGCEGVGSVCTPYRRSATGSACGSSPTDRLSHPVLPQPIKIRPWESRLHNWTNFVVQENWSHRS